MHEAIADTGPALHLHEIGCLKALSIFDNLVMPNLVAEELRAYGLDPTQLGVKGLSTTITTVQRKEWGPLIGAGDQPPIHPADAQVFVLAQASQFQIPVLTDDLALRRRPENQQATVVGSVGILVRAYTTGHLNRGELESAIDTLVTESTLYMSPAFRTYVRHLVANLP